LNATLTTVAAVGEHGSDDCIFTYLLT